MSNKIRIGIIGTGGIAASHVNAYKQLDFVEVVGAADVIPGKASEFIERLGLQDARSFDSYHELLELDLDGVSICTPNVAHYQTTVDSLNAGKHVLVEKPLSVTLAEGIEMADSAARTGKILTVGFQPRYDPNMAILKDIVQSGQLGHVYYVETGGGRRRGMPGGTFVRKDLAGAGALADIGCYSLDLAMNALGYPKPVTVSAYSSNHFGTNPLYHPEASKFEVEDFGVALVRFDNGVTLNFKISWAMHMDTLGATMFLGTDAGLKVTPAGKGPWSGVWDGGIGSMTLYHDIRGHHTESPIPLKEHSVNRFFEKVRDFAEAIRDGREAPIPASQIVRNQAVIDGILRSAELKREVTIELPAHL